MRGLDLSGLDESALRTLSNAKEKFKDARRKATEAFANEALELSDRVLAMQYRVMATILETLDNPEDALAACRVCIEQLHSLSAVKECFTVELKKSFLRGYFRKDERRNIICTVCRLNRVIYDVTFMVARRGELLKLKHHVDIGEEKIDLLRDVRLAQVLREQGMEDCSVVLSFGHEGKEEHKLKSPRGIAANADGQFIIADDGDKSLKMFDSSGNFIMSFNPQTEESDKQLDIFGVAADVNCRTYVRLRLGRRGVFVWTDEHEMQVFTKATDVQSKFPVKRGNWRSNLTVSNTKIMVVDDEVGVHIYKHDGGYVGSFDEGLLRFPRGITAGPDGHVMVLDNRCVYVFAENGEHRYKFTLNNAEDSYKIIASNPANAYVVVAYEERQNTGLYGVEIYSTNGEFE